ncbi:MAG: M28 family peptidase, partial [Gammaproteobacteria bacterium]|nr:M28 family peptidase [Gammaproteobacteria bacterium]
MRTVTASAGVPRPAFLSCRIGAAALPAAAMVALTALTASLAVPHAAAQQTPSGSAPFTAEQQNAAAAIDGAGIRGVVEEISSDRYAGRAPGTEGDEMTLEYLADRLEQIGFRPGAADGSWRQPFELVGITAAQPPEWSFSRGGETLTLAQHEEFIVASGVQSERAEVDDAEVVFVGYGIQAPEHDWDDFKGADLDGKILLMLNNDPDWDPELFAGQERLYYGRWTYKYESAARQGAAGAIIVHTQPSSGYPWQVVQTSWTGTQYELPAGEEPRMQVEAWVSEGAAERLVQLGGHALDELVERAKERDFEPVPLGVHTSIELTNRLERTSTANVIGVLPGSDAELADEYVVYTAHHDHLGVAESGEDRVYNGARDNATGVGMLLEIGEAFAALPEPPRRSIMLLLVGAEEQGLLGSEYFSRHPTVPPGRIAANVNYDSGNIWGETEDIMFVGLGKSSLDAIARRVAEHQGRELKPDEAPDQGYYYRSDQFNFAKIGVPAFYFRGG